MDRTDATDDADINRVGVVAGVTAYSLWGLFPLVFRQLESVPSFEIVLHRVVWSLAVVAAVLFVQRDWGAMRRVRDRPGAFWRLAVAGALVAGNWLVYIWAVNHDHVIEAALGYYVNPLITVALGVVVLGESLRRAQLVALGFGAAAVVVLTVAYGRVPWIALVLALTFAAYGFLKKAVPVGAVASLAVETAVLFPVALAGLVVLQVQGTAAFGNGSGGRDLLIAALGVITAGPLLLFATAATRIPLSLLGLLQYLTPTLQLLCGLIVFSEPMPPERLAGFVLVWIALIVLGTDAVRALRQRAANRDIAAPEPL